MARAFQREILARYTWHMSKRASCILIVEDDHDHVDLLRELLRGLGHYVLTVCNREGALRIVAAFTCDLILIDVLLGNEDGIELVRELRKQEVRSRIVMVSGVADRATRLAAEAAGANAYLTKPFSFASILHELDQVVEKP